MSSCEKGRSRKVSYYYSIIIIIIIIITIITGLYEFLTSTSDKQTEDNFG